MKNFIHFFSSIWTISISFISSIVGSIIANYLYDRFWLKPKNEQEETSSGKAKKIFTINWKRISKWTIIIFVILQIFISIILYSNQKSIETSDFIRKFEDLNQKVEKIYSDFKEIPKSDIDNNNPPIDSYIRMQEIHSSVIEIKSELLSIDDAKLSIAYKTLKYDNLGYISAIYGEIEKTEFYKRNILEEGEKYIQIAIDIVKFARLQKLAEDKNYDWELLENWYDRNNTENRLNFVMAWIIACEIKNKLRVDSEISEIHKYWNLISSFYRIRYQAKHNPSLSLYIID